MASGIHKLTATKVAKLRSPGRYGDGGGLWLQVKPGGTKSWAFRFTRDGVPRQMGLGPLDTIGLAGARELAREARRILLEGADPIEDRKQRLGKKRAAELKRIDFREAARQYIAAHSAGWRSAKHGEQWRATLSLHAFPVIGDLPVTAIETAHVVRVLEPIWTTRTETASRVRGRIAAILDWAKANHFRDGENPARWHGHLDQLFPARTRVRPVVHQPALPFKKIPEFMAELRALKSISARALEFTILTACRTGEVIGARWPEFDLTEKLWTIPGERTKSGREHRVPLTGRVLTILADLPHEGADGFTFIGVSVGRPLSNMAMLQLLRGMKERDGLTVHGFRSSFRDWAGEQTNFPREVAEAALAHVLSDKTEAAYRRQDALEKRRRLMAAWEGYCNSPPVSSAVVPIRRRAP